MLGPVVLAILALWLAASALAQLPPLRRTASRVNWLGLIPNWHLFTSLLAARDVQLCVRGEGQEAWAETPHERTFRAWHALWNPRRRVRKALLDLAGDLVAARLEGRRDQARASLAYRRLLGEARRHAAGSEEVQFCVRAADPMRPEAAPDVLFVSERHRP